MARPENTQHAKARKYQSNQKMPKIGEFHLRTRSGTCWLCYNVNKLPSKNVESEQMRTALCVSCCAGNLVYGWVVNALSNRGINCCQLRSHLF
jgi:hypothetical protein